MGPVTTVLLATLLPTCFLICSLAVLSIYLYIKLRASTAERRKVRAQAATEEPATAEQAPEHVKPNPAERVPSWRPPVSFSDASAPDWKMDVAKVFVNFTYTLVWASKVLERLGYQGAPPAVILEWLQRYSSRVYAIMHLSAHIALARTSFENESESTLLPFSPETYKGLQNYFKALEGINVPSEISALLSKIPFEISATHGCINKSNLENVLNDLDELFLPLVDRDEIRAGFTYNRMLGRDKIAQAFADAVTLRLRMLASREKVELRWEETTKTSLCGLPAVYTHATKDGVLLDEPKVWRECQIWDLTEGGEYDIKRRTI